MKKISILIIVVISLFIIPCSSVSAKSIKDYRNQIAALEKKKKEEQTKSKEVQNKIDQANARINEISRKIAQAIKDQETTKKEIDELEESIKGKEQEIKDLLSFYQISDNDNFYLKFIFGADSFQDLIYRFSVAEQLTKANDDLVVEMNDLIKKNELKIKELEKKQVELDKLDDEIQKEIEKLGAKKNAIMEDTLSVDEEIKALQKQIAYFKEEGCKENQDVSTCTKNAPSANGFIIPTSTGLIENDGMSEYGYRYHPIWKENRFHSGIDITVGYGTTVMASSNGKVVYASSLWGFGNTVMLVHNVRGTEYTTLYAHLSSISVKKNDIVQRGSKIGAVGSTGDSTGPHLHFQVMKGDYYSSTSTVNPRKFVNFPRTGVRW